MVDEIADFEIEIDKDEVCRLLGYGKNDEPRLSVSSLIDEKIDKAYDLVEPQASYRMVDVDDIRHKQVFLEDGVMITSKVLSKLLSGCQKAAIFVVSIGQDLEDRVAELMTDGKMLRATVLDAIGSEAAEKTAAYVHDMVRDIANSEGIEATLRFSPGYCDWDVSQQRIIFDAMGSNPVDVSLTDECLMTPRKSVSGIIGLGSFENSFADFSPCQLCTKTDCPSRR